MEIVFIGGTGRCGTNLLKEIFSRHSDVITLPFEHRFVIDPDGLVDFYTSYSSSWSPFLADQRIRRLERLLSEVMYVRKSTKAFNRAITLLDYGGGRVSPRSYGDWELEKHFPNFRVHTDRLISTLVSFCYPGVWPGTSSYSVKPQLLYSGPKTKPELAGIIGQYLDALVSELLASTGKRVFVEDNTWNILFAGELLQFLPHAKIIHIYRDPRDVVASFVRQRWCPGDPVQAAIFYKDLMNRWFEVRGGLPEVSFLELSLEELVNAPREIMSHICTFCNLPFEEDLLDVDLSHSNQGRWKIDFSPSEQQAVALELDELVFLMGYR